MILRGTNSIFLLSVVVRIVATKLVCLIHVLFSISIVKEGILSRIESDRRLLRPDKSGLAMAMNYLAMTPGNLVIVISLHYVGFDRFAS